MYIYTGVAQYINSNDTKYNDFEDFNFEDFEWMDLSKTDAIVEKIRLNFNKLKNSYCLDFAMQIINSMQTQVNVIMANFVDDLDTYCKLCNLYKQAMNNLSACPEFLSLLSSLTEFYCDQAGSYCTPQGVVLPVLPPIEPKPCLGDPVMNPKPKTHASRCKEGFY